MKFILLPDLHFGPTKNNELIYHSLVNLIYPYIIQNHIDMIIIAGDDTDDRLSLDQSAARIYLQFVNDISQFKNSLGEPIPVRFIAGTYSHSMNQIQSFQYITSNPNLNVKTFETVGEEIYKGIHILYIPEESVYDKHEFYKDTVFSNKSHDICFGHGMFDHIGNNGWGSLEERSLKGSPVWNITDFNNVKGGVYFGHIHKSSNYKNRIYYGGSLIRFCQGEEEPKGFLVIDYCETTGNHSVEFIENPYAPKYVTVSLTSQQLKIDDVEKVIHDLTYLVQLNDIYELRVIIDKNDIELSKLQVLRKYFIQNRDNRIRIELKRDNSIQPIKSSFTGGIGCDNGEQCESQQDNISNSIMSSKHPEIINPNDWEINTINYAREAYNYDIDKNKMIDIIGKCIQMS